MYIVQMLAKSLITSHDDNYKSPLSTTSYTATKNIIKKLCRCTGAVRRATNMNNGLFPKI